IGGIQAQEVIKLLHGMEALIGRGYVFEGATHNSYAVTYPISPDCGWHDRPPSIELMAGFTSDTRLPEIWSLASERLGGVDAIDLGREIVSHLECSKCGVRETVMVTVEKIGADRALCPACGAERYPRFFHSISAGSDLLDKTIAELGLPEWDIVWARRGVNSLGIEITGDRPG